MLSKVTSQKSLDSGIYPCPSKRRKRKNSSYEPVGRGFESLQARQTKRTLHLQCPFFFWCACPRRRRAMRSPLRDGTVVLKTFHWNVFLTHSTSSAPNEKDTAFAVSFFFWCACPRRRRAMRSPLRDGTVALKTFHWNVFLTHSTSSARGRRAVCSFLWEIKLRRKKGAAESSAFFVLVKRSWRFRFAQFNRRAAENVDYFARYSS